MTHETLSNLLVQLNTTPNPDRVFLRPIAEGVEWGYFWPSEPDGCETTRGYAIFVIRNQTGTYVAVVLDMDEGDLHAFVAVEHRRKGVMSSALRDVILPWLAGRGREFQRVSFSDEAGRRLAESVGFECRDARTGEIDLTAVPPLQFPRQKPDPLDEDRQNLLLRLLTKAEQILRMAGHAAEVWMPTASCVPQEAAELAEALGDLRVQLRDDFDEVPLK